MKTLITFLIGILIGFAIYGTSKSQNTSPNYKYRATYTVEVESADEVELTKDFEIYISKDYCIDKWYYRASDKSLTLIDVIPE